MTCFIQIIHRYLTKDTLDINRRVRVNSEKCLEPTVRRKYGIPCKHNWIIWTYSRSDALLGPLITDYLLATLSQPAIHQKPKQLPPVIPKPSRGSFGNILTILFLPCLELFYLGLPGTKGNRVPKPVSFDLAGKDVQPATSVKTSVGSEASAAVSDADPVVPPKSLVASTTAHPWYVGMHWTVCS